MNLLTDPWIPVRDTLGSRQIRYQDLLCGDDNMEISLLRDDMELACLQLLVCLTQVIFMPPDVKVLRSRIRMPLTVSEYKGGKEKYSDWFDLDHPKTPFMQTRGVKGERTSIQKLFPGLPEKTSKSKTAHCFFNEVSEFRDVSATCCAIALFNQASNSPSFGGGFKGTLRGGSPITTLVAGDSLRQTVWMNVLSLIEVERILPGYEKRRIADKPTWVNPIGQAETIQTGQIGLFRGLFWQPARIELIRADVEATCDCLDGPPQKVYSGFFKEKFNFTIGTWPHPHGPRTFSAEEGRRKEKFLSFTTKAPAWTQLSEFLVRYEHENKEGQIPARVVSQFAEVLPGKPLHLIVGGYCAKKSSILERRHELFSIAHGWEENLERLQELIEIALEAKKLLCGKLYYAVKGHKDKKLKGIGGGDPQNSRGSLLPSY